MTRVVVFRFTWFFLHIGSFETSYRHYPHTFLFHDLYFEFIMFLFKIEYQKFFTRWLSRVHVPPITFEHIDTCVVSILFVFVLLLKPFVFFLLTFCLTCEVIAYLSSFGCDRFARSVTSRVDWTWERRTSPDGKSKSYLWSYSLLPMFSMH